MSESKKTKSIKNNISEQTEKIHDEKTKSDDRFINTSNKLVTKNLIIASGIKPKDKPKFSTPIRLSKKISGKAVIKGTTSAIFYEEFHKDTNTTLDTDTTLKHFRQFNSQPTLDHIRNMLTAISEKHLLDSNVQRHEFIFPYHDNYFRFKTAEKTKCYNLEGRPCLIEDCIGYNVVVNLSVTPYDFNKDDKRLIGVSVKADQIKMFVRKE